MKDDLSDFRMLRDENLLDRYVSLTKAATILGYASYVSVNALIQNKKIRPYWLPGNSKKKISLWSKAFSEQEIKQEYHLGYPFYQSFSSELVQK